MQIGELRDRQNCNHSVDILRVLEGQLCVVRVGTLAFAPPHPWRSAASSWFGVTPRRLLDASPFYGCGHRHCSQLRHFLSVLAPGSNSAAESTWRLALPMSILSARV